MSKYIDADRLKAEIEQRFWEYGMPLHDDIVTAKVDEVLALIDSLRQEQPSLPSNLDDAAFNYAELCKYDDADKLLCVEHFKAGAEWMAGQGVILNLSIDEFSCGAYNACVEQGLTSEDDVIVQIRKKH